METDPDDDVDSIPPSEDEEEQEEKIEEEPKIADAEELNITVGSHCHSLLSAPDKHVRYFVYYFKFNITYFYFRFKS